MDSRYLLPSSPLIRRDDRFSVLDDSNSVNRDDDDDDNNTHDDGLVPFWDILVHLLESSTSTSPITSPTALVDLLETISLNLRGGTNPNYRFLHAFLTTKIAIIDDEFYTRTWPGLVRLALKLPKLFPLHSLPILSRINPRLDFSREQIACLVIHQFLCTLLPPSWQDGYQDFDLWYDREQPHASAVEAYLTALFVYFQRITSQEETSPISYDIQDWNITYELHHADTVRQTRSDQLSSLTVLTLTEASTQPSLLGLPDGASVISANKFIGFGRTGTQEETHVGASPECCPAVLFTPPLQDDQVLVVRGAEAIVSVSGFGRDARCTEILPHSSVEMDRGEHCRKWSGRTMLFTDALELDLADQSLGEPVDLQPGNVRRELIKASTAFLASNDPFAMIFTGFWGCKTFGGNPGIKAAIQWCAASRAGSPMTFICSGPAQAAFAGELRDFVKHVQLIESSRMDLEQVLLNLTPEYPSGTAFLKEIMRKLEDSQSPAEPQTS